MIFVASIIANGLSYLYHLYLGRRLGPEGYGEFSSLNSFIYLLMVATTVVATSLTKYFSKCKAHNTLDQAHDLYIRSNAKLFRYLFSGFLMAIILSFPLTVHLHLSSWGNILLVYLVFCFFTLNSVNNSLFSGFQKFGLTAFSSTLTIFMRFVFAVPAAAFGVFWTMFSYGIANILTYLTTTIFAKKLLTPNRKRFDISIQSMLRSNIEVFIIMFAMTSLYSTDIVLVRSLFSAKEAGWYAGVAVLGKIIFYASAAIGQVVLPVVAERSYNGKKTLKVMGSAIAMVSVISFVCLLIFAIFPKMVIHLLFGSSYDPAVPYLFPFAVFMVMYSVINIIVMGLIASSKTGIWRVFAFAAIAQCIGIYLFHTTIGTVVTVNIVVIGILLVGVLGYFIQSERLGKIKQTS